MAGDLHVEAVVLPDGRIRVYPSDLHRRPIAPRELTGSVTVRAPDGARTLALAPADDRLEAAGPPIATSDVQLHLALVRDGRPIELHLGVPVAAPGLAGLPAACERPADADGAGGAPVCTVQFPRMVRALATTPDARTALVAVFGHGVTGWRLPAGELAFGLVPVPGTDAHADHAHPVDAVAVRPDAAEVAVTVRGQLLRYALATGDLVAELPGSPLRFRALAWSADSSRLLVSAFYDGAVHLVRSDDGQEVGRLDAGRALTAFALSPDGRLAALATELGPIALFEVASGRAAGTLPAPVPAQALAFAGNHLVAARQDGVLDVWRVADARRVASTPGGPTVVTLAAAPDGTAVATGGLDGTVRLHGVPGADLRGTLRWRPDPVQALAWAGPLLLAGDTGGGLAIWDVGSGTAAKSAGRQRAPEGTVAP